MDLLPGTSAWDQSLAQRLDPAKGEEKKEELHALSTEVAGRS